MTFFLKRRNTNSTSQRTRTSCSFAWHMCSSRGLLLTYGVAAFMEWWHNTTLFPACQQPNREKTDFVQSKYNQSSFLYILTYSLALWAQL